MPNFILITKSSYPEMKKKIFQYTTGVSWLIAFLTDVLTFSVSLIESNNELFLSSALQHV